jgi:hypothetical protein
MIIRASIALLAGLWACAALSQDASMTETFYQSLEPEYRAHYARFWEEAEVEKARKAKAGEPASTTSEWKLGITGAKTLLYNMAVTRALCAEQAGLPIKDEDAFKRDMHNCLLDRISELRKFQKMAEYNGSISPSKSVRCEMKSRDYKNELRFPPFDFLRTDGEPELQLMDHKALNDCLVSDP